MKRIHMVLVLLVAVLLVSATVLAPSVYADDGNSALSLGGLHKAGGTELTTSAMPPGGGDAEGDPDSMGDGLSKDFVESGASACDSGWLDGSALPMSIQESVLYILSQIQLLML